MASRSKRSQLGPSAWPKRAIGVFALILVVVYALVFFTGDRRPVPKLGIDLQGGTRVTLVPQGQDPTSEQLAQARTILENRVNGMGVSGAEVITDGDTLVISVPGEDTAQAKALSQTSQLMFRPVLTPTDMPSPEDNLAALETMANRWVSVGASTKEHAQKVLDDVAKTLSDNSEQLVGEKKTFNAPKVTENPPAEAKNSLEQADQRDKELEVLREDRQSDDLARQMAARQLMVCEQQEDRSQPGTLDPLAGTDDPTKPLVACDPSIGDVMLLDAVPLLEGQTDEVNGKRLTGNEIDTSQPITGGFNPERNTMEINFAFKSSGGEQGSSTWAKLTEKYLQQQIAITLDSQIISAPVIQSATPVGSGTSITGSFSQKEATELANNLRYGALPLSFAGENGELGGTTTTIPPSLGTASLQAGLIAGIVGLVLIAIFAFSYYRVFGALAIFTLVAANALVYGALVLLGRWIGYSLDLAGIAGLIIGLGTTADSFVVFYERIKDEIRDNNRTFRSAVPRGWQSAKRTILSGNTVSLIAAIVLYVLAVGSVKGFAFTLGLTTIFNLVVTFLVTAPLVLLASRRRWFNKPSRNGFGAVMKVRDERAAADSTHSSPYANEVIAGNGPIDAAGEK
ncbi:preprotein translocase subunit SecD [Corynebacterium ciconiae DSM 44920]|uniref:protein translocase subunit SecD n=1 Tax=Corynebacterium ciconiae TaxID=227319 RepID=UPI00036B66D2|nr:protein translocase subunit SecD [Corynebacterium ciconiae]WKD61335.1 preprotein translocase subunit SecD [Corynebacterium ciconiae DSM 44920]